VFPHYARQTEHDVLAAVKTPQGITKTDHTIAHPGLKAKQIFLEGFFTLKGISSTHQCVGGIEYKDNNYGLKS
jgi:hypothetical protein